MRCTYSRICLKWSPNRHKISAYKLLKGTHKHRNVTHRPKSVAACKREREREREKWLIKRGVQCMEFCHLELEKLNIEK